jgi:hypothetical protein
VEVEFYLEDESERMVKSVDDSLSDAHEWMSKTRIGKKGLHVCITVSVSIFMPVSFRLMETLSLASANSSIFDT